METDHFSEAMKGKNITTIPLAPPQSGLTRDQTFGELQLVRITLLNGNACKSQFYCV